MVQKIKGMQNGSWLDYLFVRVKSIVCFSGYLRLHGVFSCRRGGGFRGAQETREGIASNADRGAGGAAAAAATTAASRLRERGSPCSGAISQLLLKKFEPASVDSLLTDGVVCQEWNFTKLGQMGRFGSHRPVMQRCLFNPNQLQMHGLCFRSSLYIKAFGL